MKDRSTKPFDVKEGSHADIGKAAMGPVRLAMRGFTRAPRRAPAPRPAPSKKAGELAGWLR